MTDAVLEIAVTSSSETNQLDSNSQAEKAVTETSGLSAETTEEKKRSVGPAAKASMEVAEEKSKSRTPSPNRAGSQEAASPAKSDLMEAQEIIHRQGEQLREVQITKQQLEDMQEERKRLLRELEEAQKEVSEEDNVTGKKRATLDLEARENPTKKEPGLQTAVEEAGQDAVGEDAIMSGGKACDPPLKAVFDTDCKEIREGCCKVEGMVTTNGSQSLPDETSMVQRYSSNPSDGWMFYDPSSFSRLIFSVPDPNYLADPVLMARRLSSRNGVLVRTVRGGIGRGELRHGATSVEPPGPFPSAEPTAEQVPNAEQSEQTTQSTARLMKNSIRVGPTLAKMIFPRLIKRAERATGKLRTNFGEYWSVKLLKKANKLAGGDPVKLAKLVNSFIASRRWSAFDLYQFVDFLLRTGIPDETLKLIAYQPAHELPKSCGDVTDSMPFNPNANCYNTIKPEQVYCAMWVVAAMMEQEPELARQLAIHFELLGLAKVIGDKIKSRELLSTVGLRDAVDFACVHIVNDCKAHTKFSYVDRFECPAYACGYKGTLIDLKAHVKQRHQNIVFDECIDCEAPVPVTKDPTEHILICHMVKCPKRRTVHFKLPSDYPYNAIDQVHPSLESKIGQILFPKDQKLEMGVEVAVGKGSL